MTAPPLVGGADAGRGGRLAGRPRLLNRLDPLAPVAAALPAMLYVVLTEDVATPLAFLVLAIGLLLVGARLPARRVLALLLGFPAAVLVLSVTFGLWTDPARVDDAVTLFAVGGFSFSLGAWQSGLATALRIAALVALALLGGLTSTGPDLVRSCVAHLRVPYRIGYTALAAFRFVPRFAHELEVIRSAHRVRGLAGGRGPVAAVRRRAGYAVPLLAGAIRHAERVALAMDSRAFGAHPTRTERHRSHFGVREAAFVVAFWVISAAIAWFVPVAAHILGLP